MNKLILHTSFKDLKGNNSKKIVSSNLLKENIEYKDFLLLLSKNSTSKLAVINKQKDNFK